MKTRVEEVEVPVHCCGKRGFADTDAPSSVVRKVALVLGFIALPLALLGYSEYQWISQIHFEATREKTGAPFDAGNEIVHAISAFAVETGRLPKSLDELTPDFLESMPSPEWGEGQWDYSMLPASKSRPAAFSLGAPRKKGLRSGHYYDSRFATWEFER